jgi:hypothetical protein
VRLLIGGGLLTLGALFDKEYALGLLGIGAIINAVMMFGFAGIIKNVARIAWHSKKANEQREALVSQAYENAKLSNGWWRTVRGENE